MSQAQPVVAADPFAITVGKLAQADAIAAFMTIAEGSTSNEETLRRMRVYFSAVSQPWWALWGDPRRTP